jgi:hypothetical protein
MNFPSTRLFSRGRHACGRSRLRSIAATIAIVVAGINSIPAARAATIFTDDYEGGVKFTNPNLAVNTLGSIQTVGTSISPTKILQLTNFPGTNGVLYTLPETYALGTYSLSFWHIRASGFQGSS